MITRLRDYKLRIWDIVSGELLNTQHIDEETSGPLSPNVLLSGLEISLSRDIDIDCHSGLASSQAHVAYRLFYFNTSIFNASVA